MKRVLSLLLCITILCSGSLVSHASVTENQTNNFKVMGYFSESPFNDPIDESIQFKGLTHLIYAFVKPNADGTLVPIKKPERLKELVEKSHQNGVKVIIAVGGIRNGNELMVTNFETLTASDKTTKVFVNEMAKFVDTYNLDGVEIDWEYPYPHTQAKFEKLMVALRSMLTEKGKTLSAAVAGATSVNTFAPTVTSLTDKSLACCDWINIMAYDLGSGISGQQSPYWFADTSIDYFLNRNVPAEKIVVGLPLFARPSWKQYRDLVKLDKENAYKDYVPGEKLASYYNGLNTIMDKTRLSLNHAGGIMFFDINEDTHDETSAQAAAIDMISRYEKYKLNDLLIIVNNHELTFPADMGKSYIDKRGRTLVPVRRALEALGATVAYDPATSAVTITKDKMVLSLKIGSDKLVVNGVETQMDTRAVVKEGRTYLPLRAIYEHFGYTLTFHSDSMTILVDPEEAAQN